MSSDDKIIGNDRLIDDFATQLQSGPCICLIIGPGQGGKTKMCMHTFEASGFAIHRVIGDIQNAKDLAKQIEAHRDTFTISSFFCSKPKVIFLDDFDIYGTEKSMQTYILSFVKHANFLSSGLRVVLTISSVNEKLCQDLKKKCVTFRIQNPSIADAYQYVSTLHPDIEPLVLKQLCFDMDGCIGSVLTRIKFSQSDAMSLAVKDKTVFDILYSLFAKNINMDDSDILVAYDPRLLAMLYFDNMTPQSSTHRHNTARTFADVHVLDELSRGSPISLANDIWCMYLTGQPRQPDKSLDSTAKYGYTRILQRTAARCSLNKRIHNIMTKLNIDQDSREVFFDVVSDMVLTKGKKMVDDEVYAICREYLQTIGDIKKEFLDKLECVLK